MAGKPCIITVAITGSVPTKKDNPAVPVTVAEQIESTHASYEAGASLAHIHVRNDDGTVSSNPDRFAEVGEGIRKHCPGMIIQFSTGGRSGVGTERGGMLHHRPDMASLSTGSCNFPLRIYENHPDLIKELASKMIQYDIKPEIEAFDVSMMYQAVMMSEAGMLKKPLHVQFVLGVKNALPCIRQVLDFQVAELKRLQPQATWTAAGIAKHQLECNHWALEMGGHCRTGLEDNIRFEKTELAKSNAQLVKRVADLCAKYDRPVATPKQAREMLGLRAA
jgi:3-keto-5-aminohexanoate cleavage enzyme